MRKQVLHLALVLLVMGTGILALGVEGRKPPPVALATTGTVVTWEIVIPTTTMTEAVTRPVKARASRSAVRVRPVRVGVDEAVRARVIAAICSYGDWDCGLMVRVAGCESGLNPWAQNGRHRGIFQIAGSTLGLVEEHVALAHSMWRSRGLQPWYPSRGCWG